jgi:hypothetical protein
MFTVHQNVLWSALVKSAQSLRLTFKVLWPVREQTGDWSIGNGVH